MSISSTPRKKSDFLLLGDETYLLHKVDKSAGSSRYRDKCSEPLRFDDPVFKDMKTYVYDALPEKRIRLMRLKGGPLTDSIQCELIEAYYNNSFHIPTEANREKLVSQTSELEGHSQTKEELRLAKYEEKVAKAQGEIERAEKGISEAEEELAKAEYGMAIWRKAPWSYLALLSTYLARYIATLGESLLYSTFVYHCLVGPLATTQEMFAGPGADMTAEELDSTRERLKLAKETLGLARLKLELVMVENIEREYEALSWCWGRDVSDYAVTVIKGSESYKMAVRKDLALALKYLRYQEKTRILWIDAICINQDNSVERNQQVQMMSRIYTRAANVCIWLGEDDDQSELAFNFIKQEITHLKNFDSISSDMNYSDKWQALMVLMQREWFSRRWVVQELSLANKAEIWCGPNSMPWKEFAVAVELFVEVESATHRLSEVMQKDEKFQHIPGWFEHVSELGASLLVQATGKVFRVYGTPMDDNKGDDKEDPNMKMTDQQKADKEEAARVEAAKKKHDQRKESLQAIQTIDPLDRRSLLSLEFLVTTMFIFKASECRDSVYSMLAIARDAAPYAEPSSSTNDVSFRMSLFEGFLAEKPFLVDYARPYSDVCRDFMEFCIQRKNSLDPIQALDILCRPWALEPQKGRSIRLKTNKDPTTSQIEPPPRLLVRDQNQPWQKRKCKVRIRKDSFRWVYEKQKNDKWTEDERDMKQYREENKEKDEGRREDPSWVKGSVRWKKPEGWEKVLSCLEGPREPKKKGRKTYMELSKDINLPSWVPRAKNAPFEIYRHPGIQMKKTGRANADPLVGWPQDGHRNYSAAQTETVKLECLKFRKRPHMGHYSLYVAGFEVDVVDEVKDASQGGSIPNSWLELSGWDPPYDKDPPAEFWRTIVADRGFDNHNPPYYYARACRESVNKGGRESGAVNTTALINNERNSIIAEFCRRVHAVIWGRSLFRTKQGKLGLAKEVKKGDLVCILHGCTVPVILSRRSKNKGEREEEEFEDRFEAFKSCVQRMENICVRKKRYEQQKRKHEEQAEEHELLDKMNQEQHDRTSNWKEDVVAAREKVNNILAIDRKTRMKKQELDAERKRVLERKDDNGDKKKEPDPRFKPDKENFYIFKGESYVHGCMDGEAVRERFYVAQKEQIFEMR